MSLGQKVAALLFIFGIAQFSIALLIAPMLHPGFSLSKNYLSDLGIGPYALIFNLSAIALGIMLLGGVYFLKQNPNLKPIKQTLFLMSFAVMAVGIFTKELTVAHGIVSSIAFLLASVAAFTSAKILKKAPASISVLLGGIIFGSIALFSIGMLTSGSLTSTIAFDSPFYLGIGPGGMESMIVVPSLMWLAIFSICLVTERGFKKESQKSLQ